MSKSVFDHPVVPVEYEGQEVLIDEEVAPLCQAIWRLGIKTRFSCQDVNGRVQVVFPDICELDRFLSYFLGASNRNDGGYFTLIDGEYCLVSVYDKITYFSGGMKKDQWSAELCNYRPGEGFFASLTFPRSDLPEVMKLLGSSK